MKRQLDEMKKDREMMSQPLIYVLPQKVILQKPKLYFSPPEKKYAGHSRLHIECEFTNPGNAPGLSVAICSCLVLPGTNKKDDIFFDSAKEFLAIVSANSNIEPEKQIHIIFSQDRKGLIIDALRALRHDKLPLLRICAAYKNVSGGCFVCRHKFNLLYDPDKTDPVLESWQAQIAAFQSLLKNEIREMKKQSGKNDELHSTLFLQAQSKYDEGIKEKIRNSASCHYL